LRPRFGGVDQPEVAQPVAVDVVVPFELFDRIATRGDGVFFQFLKGAGDVAAHVARQVGIVE